MVVRSGRCVWIIHRGRVAAALIPIPLPSVCGICPVCGTKGRSLVVAVHVIGTISPGRTRGGDLVVVPNFVDVICIVSIIIPVSLVTLK